MTPEDFECLVAEAGMQCDRTSKDYGIGFCISLPVITKIPCQDGRIVYSTRYGCDWLNWQPAEFAMLTPERAQSQIADCKKRIEQAAKTKAGVIR